jgi:hypothetical protein
MPTAFRSRSLWTRGEEREGTMLENVNYNLMETITIISRSLHRYESYARDASESDCRSCIRLQVVPGNLAQDRGTAGDGTRDAPERAQRSHQHQEAGSEVVGDRSGLGVRPLCGPRRNMGLHRRGVHALAPSSCRNSPSPAGRFHPAVCREVWGTEPPAGGRRTGVA